MRLKPCRLGGPFVVTMEAAVKWIALSEWFERTFWGLPFGEPLGAEMRIDLYDR